MIVSLLLLLLAVIGTPLFVIIAAGAMNGFHSSGVDLSVMGIEIFGISETPVLLAIPLFTFAGYLLSESGAPGRLVRLTEAILGWMPAGLAIVSLAACAFFTAFTGGSGVTIIALGALLYPALQQAGYQDRFNLGLVTTSGSLGLLFAPSLPLILYGVVAGISIDDLFLAGVLPGTLMVLLLGGYAVFASRRQKLPLKPFSGREMLAALWESRWELPLPVVVLGGIYSGVLAVSEAATVTALYVLLAEVFIQKEISIGRLPGIVRESMMLVGGIFVILGVSLASTNYMIDAGIPTMLVEKVNALVSGPQSFLLLLLAFLLVLGAILDIFSATVLVVPLIIPVATRYGINPVHLGMIFLATMELGYLTPPVGLNLFISSYRFDKPILEVYAATVPFLLMLLIAVLLIIYVPQLSLLLLG